MKDRELDFSTVIRKIVSLPLKNVRNVFLWFFYLNLTDENFFCFFNRATTEFTGWPKPSTTPISIEKLLEAARTATVSSLSNTSVELSTSTVSSTSTTTTTTTTPRPTTPGICDDECKVAGTIRLVGSATWVPELLDRNTREWQDLADRIEKEVRNTSFH